MTKGECIVREAAETDLDEILDYIRPHNRTAARKLVMAVRKDFDLLATFPRAGALRDSKQFPGLRSWPVRGYRKYLIFYLPTPTGIDVVRILHGMRDVDSIMG